MASSATESAASQAQRSPSLVTFSPSSVRHIKQGIKTGIAGVVAYALYAGFHLREGYWAVFSALVVSQANLGASWQAALYRTIGTTAGAVAAALLAMFLGVGSVRTGALLFLLAALFAYLTARHASFSAAGYSVAVVLFFSRPHEYWQIAWYRVLYTMVGAVIAFVVSVLVWPMRARDSVRNKIALLLEDCSCLIAQVTDGVLQGAVEDVELERTRQRIVEHRRALTQGLEEARSEPARSRFDYDAFASFVEQLDRLRLRLLAMSADSTLYIVAGIHIDLIPHLPELCTRIRDHLAGLAANLQHKGPGLNPLPLGEAVAKIDDDLACLRQTRATAPFALDRMLSFWSFVFNLKETAADVESLQQKLPQLSAP